MWFALLFLFPSTETVRQFPEKRFLREDLECHSLLVDIPSASLYVGCKHHIFKLWAYNVNDTSDNVMASRSLTVSDKDETDCRSMASPADCVPVVRQMFFRPTADSIIICSSVAMKPELRVLDMARLTDKEEARTVIGVCSPDARFNGTAVHVEWGNPNDAPAIYAGIRTGMSGENHLVYRPPITDKGKELFPAIKTIYTDNTWLNEPQFVGSFDIGEYVYFFFRELAVEVGFAPSTMYSRVARVCKKDTGGKSILRQTWTSFVKARLNCSMGGTRFPFQFDHIQSVSRVEMDGETLFYASMSSSESVFPTSAICVFSLSAIDSLFSHGVFLEQQNGIWLPTPLDSVPSHRPGTCVANSSSLSDSDLHFAKSHLLLADAVDGGVPLIPTRDVFFHSVLVDVLPEQNVLFAINYRDGQVWKVAHWKEGSTYRSEFLTTFHLNVQGRIFASVLLPHEYLYVSTRGGISQFSISSCAVHLTCSSCAIDPFCSWSVANAECEKREKAQGTGWISSWAGRGAGECASISPREIVAHIGDALHMRGNGTWTKDRRILERASTVQGVHGDIILLNINEDDAGEYASGHNKYSVTIDTECTRPSTLAAYHSCQREYCKEMHEYKETQREWEKCTDSL